MKLKKEFIQQILSIISTARDKAIRSVDTERVLMYWEIGKVIFEEEQEGKERAGYGDFLIKSLAKNAFRSLLKMVVRCSHSAAL